MSNIRFTVQYIDFVVLYNVSQETLNAGFMLEVLLIALQHIWAWTLSPSDLCCIQRQSMLIKLWDAAGLMWLLRFQSSCSSLRGVNPLLFLLFWLHPPLYLDHPSIDPHQVHFPQLLPPIIETLRKWSMTPKASRWSSVACCVVRHLSLDASASCRIFCKNVSLNRDIKQNLYVWFDQ